MKDNQTGESGGISRRKLLSYSILGLALAAVGGTGMMALQGGDYQPLPEGVSLLTAREYSVLYTLIDSYFPAYGSSYPNVGEAGVVSYLASEILPNISPASRTDLKRVLNLLEYTPLALIGSPSRFSTLPAQRRAELLGSLMRSDSGFRQMIFTTFKKLAITAYYIHPFSWTAVGYDGPLKPRLGAAAPAPLGISTIAGGNPSSTAPGRPSALRFSDPQLAVSGVTP